MAEQQRPDWGPLATEFAARSLAADDPTGWFERIYAAGRSGTVSMPWDRPANPILLSWLAKGEVVGEGRTAVVVGCGLGGDAEELARRGFRTTAFDVAPTAVTVARERHPDSTVGYRVADLFALPAEWRRAFDFVVEAVTVQALPPARQKTAAGAVAELVAPGGTLLVITGVRDGSTSIALEDGPPWPLRREDVANFAVGGLEPVATDEIRFGTSSVSVAELRCR
jgi:SAM-dependent methyltransferase